MAVRLIVGLLGLSAVGCGHLLTAPPEPSDAGPSTSKPGADGSVTLPPSVGVGDGDAAVDPCAVNDHGDGAGDWFISCEPQRTYNATTARLACEAFHAKHPDEVNLCANLTSPLCAGAAIAAFRGDGRILAIWQYTGALAGRMTQTQLCPTDADVEWL